MSTNEEIKAITFADFLKQHLEDRQLSAEWLGRELNIDGGLVRSWVRGDRIPALGHSCIPKIAEILEISIIEIKDIQEKSLIEKQSLRKIKRQTKHISEELKLLACVDKSLAKISREDIQIEDCRYLSAIQGIKKVVGTAISIIEYLPNATDENQKIILTFQGRKSIFEQQKILNERWLTAISEVLQRGWNIEHIIRLDNDWQRVILYMSFMLEIIGGQGNYHPYCFQQKYVLEPHNGYLIIPGKEALQFFATEQKLHTDAAIYIKDIEQIKIMEKYIFQLKEEAEPIFKRYNTYQQPEFVKAISKADEQPVNRTVILKRLSEITRPLSWYNPKSEWAKALKSFLEINTKTLAEHLEIRKNRRLKLEKHLDRYRCRYIYTSSCINSFIKTGMSSEQNYFIASPQQRVEQLQNMIKLLNFTNYEMAILEEKDDDDIFSKIKPSFCEVQGSHVFFMEVWSKNDDGKNLSEWFLTHEPTITRAFQEYFSKIWNSIPSKSKDKFELLKRLQQHIQDLEKE